MRPPTRTRLDTAGTAPGSIIAAIIDAHAATKNSNEPSSVATPMSIPSICRTAMTQAAAASPNVGTSGAAGTVVLALVILCGTRRRSLFPARRLCGAELHEAGTIAVRLVRLVVPDPPLVRRALGVALRRVLPLLLAPERGDVQAVPGVPHLLVAAGVERVSRVTGIHDGSPQLEDGRTVEVANVVWCTGFHPGFSWIDLPVLGPQEPLHKRGVVASEPGLYFIGLKFLYSVSSEQIQGVGRDADYIAKRIAAGRNARRAGRSVGDSSEERDVMASSAGA